MGRFSLRVPLPAFTCSIAMGLACSNTMHGTIDGESVGPVNSSLFWEDEQGPVVLVLTGIPDACQVLGNLGAMQRGDCDSYCEAFTWVAEEFLAKDEYWLLTMAVMPDDGRSSPEAVYSLLDGDGQPEDEFNAAIDKLDWTSLRDVEECLSECESRDSAVGVDRRFAVGGTVEVTDFDFVEADPYLHRGERTVIKGHYDIEFPGGDTVDGRFNSSDDCPGYFLYEGWHVSSDSAEAWLPLE